MKKFILRFWWILPALMVFLMALLCIIMVANLPATLEAVVDCLLLLVILSILVSWVILLIDRQWKKCLFSFLITVLAGGALSFLLFIALFAPRSDDFGKKHAIPIGFAYNVPFEGSSDPTVVIDSLDTDSCLQIWDEFQGGIYRYDFYYGPLPAGEIFLRCYEATENIRLSVDWVFGDRIYESSKVAVDATTSFSKLVDKQKFTIYEGEWEDYYAARIEVWHKNARTGEETKLMEKVYRVEGWMR